MMTDPLSPDLANRLRADRRVSRHLGSGGMAHETLRAPPLDLEAADALDRQRAEIERLTQERDHYERGTMALALDVKVLQRALQAKESAAETTTERVPSGYAYRRRLAYGADGGTYIAFDSGGIVNGSEPLEAIPYWLGPARPTDFPKRPGDCDHAEAHLMCNGCGIDFANARLQWPRKPSDGAAHQSPSHDLDCDHPEAAQKSVATNSGTVTVCEVCSESRFTPWQAEQALAGEANTASPEEANSHPEKRA